jgi:hypothetical protein
VTAWTAARAQQRHPMETMLRGMGWSGNVFSLRRKAFESRNPTLRYTASHDKRPNATCAIWDFCRLQIPCCPMFSMAHLHSASTFSYNIARIPASGANLPGDHPPCDIFYVQVEARTRRTSRVSAACKAHSSKEKRHGIFGRGRKDWWSCDCRRGC